MTQQFDDSAKQISDELIEMSTLLAGKMETWADVFARHPDSQNAGSCAGFISNQDAVNRIELVIDAQTPPDESSGMLRTRAIETTVDEQGNERFNSIALHYAVGHASAQQLVAKGGAVSRDELKQLLHADATGLTDITIGDETGRDSNTQQSLGKRYDLDADELDAMTEATEEELIQAAKTVLTKLKQATASEAK